MTKRYAIPTPALIDEMATADTFLSIAKRRGFDSQSGVASLAKRRGIDRKTLPCGVQLITKGQKLSHMPTSEVERLTEEIAGAANAFDTMVRNLHAYKKQKHWDEEIARLAQHRIDRQVIRVKQLQEDLKELRGY
jgi:predicted regulator of amino acid metabolism with ACT domain